MKSVNGYESLADVLERAYEQATTGKGAERHAQDLPFEQQPMQKLIDLYGPGFALGQAAKKAQESQRLPAGRDVAELLGAINYLAGAVIALERDHLLKQFDGESNAELAARIVDAHNYQRNKLTANDNEQPHDCCPVCQHVDGQHHEKCTMAEQQNSTAIVQIKRLNELSETALKMLANHVEAELLRIKADKMTGKNLYR